MLACGSKPVVSSIWQRILSSFKPFGWGEALISSKSSSTETDLKKKLLLAEISVSVKGRKRRNQVRKTKRRIFRAARYWTRGSTAFRIPLGLPLGTAEMLQKDALIKSADFLFVGTWRFSRAMKEESGFYTFLFIKKMFIFGSGWQFIQDDHAAKWHFFP